MYASDHHPIVRFMPLLFFFFFCSSRWLKHQLSISSKIIYIFNSSNTMNSDLYSWNLQMSCFGKKHISFWLTRQITVINLGLRKGKNQTKIILAVDPFPTSRGIPASRAQSLKDCWANDGFCFFQQVALHLGVFYISTDAGAAAWICESKNFIMWRSSSSHSYSVRLKKKMKIMQTSHVDYWHYDLLPLECCGILYIYFVFYYRKNIDMLSTPSNYCSSWYKLRQTLCMHSVL